MDPPVQPATIESLNAIGVVGFDVRCQTQDCWHQGTVRFERTCLPPETPFPSIPARRRFVCTSCGGRVVAIMPDWTTMRAKGRGWGSNEAGQMRR